MGSALGNNQVVGAVSAGRTRRFGPRRSLWLRAALGLAVAFAAFRWALPAFASYGAVGHVLDGIDARLVPLLLLLGLANITSPAVNQRAALPGLKLRHAVAADWATTAVTNTVPGGSAVAVGMTWSMYRSHGLPSRDIARCLVVTGVLDTIVKFATPLVAVLWLSTERPVGAGLREAAVVGVALFSVVLVLGAILLSGPSVAEGLGRLLGRLRLGAHWPQRLRHLRDDTVSLLRTRWWILTFWIVAGHLNLYLLLTLCLRAVGVPSSELSLAAILAALAFGRLVTALPVSPGGLGVLEVGLTGALAAVGRADHAALVAAVLLFRCCTFLLPIPLGIVTWTAWTLRRRPPAGTATGSPAILLAEVADPA